MMINDFKPKKIKEPVQHTTQKQPPGTARNRLREAAGKRALFTRQQPPGTARDRLREAARDRYAAARKFGESLRRKVIGYFGSYTPVELIEAAGAIPLRILGSDIAEIHSAKHLQTYSCSLVKSSLDMLLQGRLDFLDGVIFTHSCDALQSLSDIWRLNRPDMKHINLMVPTKLSTLSTRDYLIEELSGFINRLSMLLEREITTEDIRQSIMDCNHNRKLMRWFYDAMSANPLEVPATQLLWANLARTAMPRAEHSSLLAASLSDLAFLSAGSVESGFPAPPQREGPGKPATVSNKVRIMISGEFLPDEQLITMIETAGGVVVDDDLSIGSREIHADIDEVMDPVNAIADWMNRRVASPSRHHPRKERCDYIMEKLRSNGASGVIFALPKFCETHAFDYPHIKAALDEAHIPNMSIEIEHRMDAPMRVQTRIDAFIEMVIERVKEPERGDHE